MTFTKNLEEKESRAKLVRRLVRLSDFSAWSAAWEAAGRCPLVFADWLADRGFTAEAEGAVWAASVTDRVFPVLGSVRPYAWKRRYGWNNFAVAPVWQSSIPKPVYNRLPDLRVNRERYRSSTYTSYDVAIAAFLAAWPDNP